MRVGSPGTFSDFFSVPHPLGIGNANLLRADRFFRGVLAELIGIYSDEDLPEYVDESRLFPCLLTDNGDVGYWVADTGDPDGWTVAVNAARSPDRRRTGRSLSALLHSHVTAEEIQDGPFGSVFEEGDRAEFSSDF
ncbi:hypothetical protein J0910_14035 [Nocardiopsis sp. CNT-189]|uniref:hypothetical protein n=1 Tax=Nocardiopsis oceanisediminis TaxID=2816862 RepID=UPI003B339BD8